MSLRIFLLLLWILVLAGSTGCEPRNTKATASKNDTAEIMRILVDSAFHKNKLPNIEKLVLRHFFGDSVLFKFDSSLMTHAPKETNGLKFKFLTEEQICRLATQYFDRRNDTTFEVHYVKVLRLLKRNDTSYMAELQNAMMSPPQVAHYLDPHNTECIFGEPFGGGIRMSFTKQGDTLRGRIEGSWPF